MTRYVVGIDLGTTNCAVGYADLDSARGAADIRLFDIQQVVATGEVEARATLPSFLLLPTVHEVKREAMLLPWDGAPSSVVGTMARDRGAELPQRLVSSAKSWLSHTGVDRKAPILPWLGAEDKHRDKPKATGERISPVDASARYLSHIQAAWNAAHPDAPLGQQDILLTVPASFDAVARELTVAAARQAGLENVTLLEEPQAAFYSWLARNDTRSGDTSASPDATDWRGQIAPGDVVLVCDIGGGTTDFSLIAVTDDGAGNLALERVAVGDHILLGGDNMDLALAHVVMQGLGRKAKKLKAMQQRALVHACRRAKEILLASDAPESVPVSILGTGSRLIGGTIRTSVRGEDVHRMMRDGFFPVVDAGARPQTRRTVGLRELGLPYASDPAVTRHLAEFLSRHGRMPTAILYNGGVMKGSLLRERVAGIVGGWFSSSDEPPRVLSSSGEYLDLAVAHGAAYYGLVRQGKGIRIRGGTARAYYIGVESSMPAIPGFPPPVKCLCVAPFGMEEGSSVDLPEHELGLVVGETAEFRFFASSHLDEDEAGTLRDPDDDEDELVELDPVEALLPATEHTEAGDVVPVSLRSRVTEVGTLDIWCVARDRRGQWKLEYSVRDDGTLEGLHEAEHEHDGERELADDEPAGDEPPDDEPPGMGGD